eukprot:CAMPEP_0118844382 /NCGR_PEP_ID=MMETSP1162-20130426/85719_1 /TAXON_ID=33656 /ORGANISM="Phaeocystis Sp, Strain CCMP2710" /LENGTH=38 /DNA_ID= /DNA_START= /DNA_END= /DNA_ORIENTATION=
MASTTAKFCFTPSPSLVLFGAFAMKASTRFAYILALSE